MVNNYASPTANAQQIAVTPDGVGVQTTNVINAVSGEKELMMTFVNADDEAAHDVTIKRGGWLGAGVNDEDISMSAGNGFASYESMQLYFDKIRTMTVGCRITTDDPLNFDSQLECTEKAPDGTEVMVPIKLSKYKQPLGGGSYANEVVIPAKDLKLVFWPGLNIVFKNLVKETSITFYFPLRGWNKSTELTPLRQSNL